MGITSKFLSQFLFIVSSPFLFLQSQPVAASIFEYFKTAEGSTNWQYVANWSSGVLILLLSMAAIVLYKGRREINSANKSLTVINNELEQRVQERTATLAKSNQLLTESNNLLEGEIKKHMTTAGQLQTSEDYIKNILESMPLMLVGLDKEGLITQWNKGAENITGLKAIDVLNRVLWDAYPIIPVSRDKVEQALAENKTITISRSQHSQFHFEITIYPLEATQNIGVVILIDDVTQQVISQNKLIERDKISNMGELAATMAHDIDAPLHTIITDIEKAQQLVASAKLEEGELQPLFSLLTNAGDQSQRTAAIIKNLLTFASSHDDVQKPASITGIMDKTLQLATKIFSFPQGLKFTDITIIRDYQEGLPEVPCFASELQQVFLSLLRHAFRSLSEYEVEAENPEIRVKVLECYDALWIKIGHNGCPLSVDEQQFIFEPYFGNEPSNQASHYDASMLLSFPYFIITEHHGGQMAVTSNTKHGTTFNMQLQLT